MLINILNKFKKNVTNLYIVKKTVLFNFRDLLFPILSKRDENFSLKYLK